LAGIQKITHCHGLAAGQLGTANAQHFLALGTAGNAQVFVAMCQQRTGGRWRLFTLLDAGHE
jgi:hypothetical protein